MASPALRDQKTKEAVSRMDTTGDPVDSRTAGTDRGVVNDSHSPLPWRASDDPHFCGTTYTWLVLNARTGVNEANVTAHGMSKVDAEFIVRAVNHHGALFAALGNLVDVLDPLHLTWDQCVALDAAVVALGKAEAK